MKLANSPGLSSLRQRLIYHTWGDLGFPTAIPTITNSGNLGYKTVGLGDISVTYELTCTLPRSGTAVNHALIASSPSNGAATPWVISHAGHGMHYFSGNTLDVDYNAQGMCTQTAALGWHTMGVCMVGYGYNPIPSLHLTKLSGEKVIIWSGDHDGSMIDGDGGISALAFFIEPIIQGINWIKANYPNAPIYMYGLSGGGWSCDYAPALDPRIEKSYNVMGSEPFNVQDANPPASTDWEQSRNRNWWTDVLGVKEEYLYALGCIEPGRRKVIVCGTDDPTWHVAGSETLLFAARDAVQAVTPPGQFDIWIDRHSKVHGYSAWSLPRIFADMAI
jgi:hypothetical protein